MFAELETRLQDLSNDINDMLNFDNRVRNNDHLKFALILSTSSHTNGGLDCGRLA